SSTTNTRIAFGATIRVELEEIIDRCFPFHYHNGDVSLGMINHIQKNLPAKERRDIIELFMSDHDQLLLNVVNDIILMHVFVVKFA
ncbi:hypothetical protein SGI37_20505, partial [Providencia rettgeri]